MRLGTSVLLLLLLCTSAFPQKAAPRKAPEFAFTQINGGQTPLSQYAGKTVLLEIVSTTCQYCGPALQALNRLQEEFGRRDLQAVAVAVNPNASVLVDDFAKEQHLTFPFGWCTREQARKLLALTPSDRFVVPQLVLINPTGEIIQQTAPQGEDPLRNESTLRARLSAILTPVARTEGRAK
jgi:peroxiredoxin